METATKQSTPSVHGATKRYDILAITACLSLLLLVLGGWLTYLGLGPWYDRLDFPPFQPPAWLFTPMWTVVLSLLAWATWCVWRQEGQSRGVGLALALFGAQFVLNVGWSLLFFTLRRPDVALWELLVLDATLLMMIFAYGKVSKKAGLLLLPYLAWLLFSTAINGWIVQNNPSFAGPAPISSSDNSPTASPDRGLVNQGESVSSGLSATGQDEIRRL